MDGLRKTIYLIIALCLSLSIPLSTANAQDNSRIERATLSGESVTIQVSVPRGRTIENAELQGPAQPIRLGAAPVPSDITLWLVLDQSEAIINAAPTIQTGITRFINGFSAETQIGILLYNNSLQQYQPTVTRSEINAWLSGYSGRANSPNCLGTALEALNENISGTTGTHRVLIIAASPVRQSACPSANLNLSVPADLIIVADTIDPSYQDVQDRFGGRLLRANIQTVSNRLDEIKSLWSNPVYELSGILPQDVNNTNLVITLSDKTRVTLPVTFEEISLQAETLTTSSGLTALGDLVTQAPTEAASITTTQRNTTQQTENTAASPTEVMIGAVVQATSQPTNQSASSTEPTTVAQGSSQANTRESAASESQQAPQPNVVEPETPTETADESFTLETLTSQPILLAIGTLILTIGVIILVLARRKKPEPERAGTIRGFPTTGHVGFNRHDETVIEATMIEFGTSEHPNMDALDITEMLDDAPQPTAQPEIDLFEVTEIVTEEELLAEPKPLVLALLHDEKTQTIYEIRRPSTLLGRQETCDIMINDKVISREHLIFEVKEDDSIEAIIITQNPILLNQERLENRTKINIGDTLKLSPNTELTVLPYEE